MRFYKSAPKTYYGKIEFLGFSGEVVEVCYYDNQNEYSKDLVECFDAGVPFKFYTQGKEKVFPKNLESKIF